MLAGYRGQSGANIQAIIDTISNLCIIAGQYQDRLVELEVNPLIALSDECIAADGLMRFTNGDTP